MASHLIRRSEVARWLRDSAVKAVTIHRTSTAIRLRRPLIVADSIDGQDMLEELRERAGTEDARAAVLAAGYDGVLIHYGPGDFWVVAYHDEQVKVVRDD
jgi:hypothetical protein